MLWYMNKLHPLRDSISTSTRVNKKFLDNFYPGYTPCVNLFLIIYPNCALFSVCVFGAPEFMFYMFLFSGVVKVIRQEKRQGLMRSRMAGIRASSAGVLVFLDSHIEAGIG